MRAARRQAARAGAALVLAAALVPAGAAPLSGMASVAAPPAPAWHPVVAAGSSGQAALPGVSANPCDRLAAEEVKFDVDGASRVTFATSRAYGNSEVLLTGCVSDGSGGYYQEWQETGFAGRNGFAPPGRMWENTLFSPTGSFTVTEALGREDPGTALTYYQVNERSRWGGEKGATYNQYFEGEGGRADENLWRYMQSGLYEQAAVINWNRPPDMPVTQGASFAIFLHAGSAETWGCISTDLATVTAFLRTAVPGDRMVMGIESDVFTASTAGSDAIAAAREAAAQAAEDRAASQKASAQRQAEDDAGAAAEPHWEPYAVVGFSLVLFAAYVATKLRASRTGRADEKPGVAQENHS